MKPGFAVLLLAAALAACGGKNSAGRDAGNGSAGEMMDRKAIAAGIMPDPQDIEFAGQFQTRSELGTDKFCAIRSSGKSFGVGMLAVYGPESKCEAQGSATVDGEDVRITFTGKGDCAFTARYDGIELRFPGVLESGCASYCSPRASLSGTHYFMVNPGDEAARKTLGRDLEKLCG